MKRAIQEQISAETAGMSDRELVEYFRRGADEFLRSIGWSDGPPDQFGRRRLRSVKPESGRPGDEAA